MARLPCASSARTGRACRRTWRTDAPEPDKEEPMTTKADFTEEEWTRLKRAPFVAGMAISLADPGGPIEALKETRATLTTVQGAEGGDRGELPAEIAREVMAE